MFDEIYPISHTEKVIAGVAEPISHLEHIIAKYGTGGSGGSGGSGTTNYNALLNKPSINGVDLVGNKTLAQLGITNYNDTQIKKDITDLQNNKVDKVTGKSLIDDTEIERLAKVDNYDDKAIKASIKTVADGLMASAGYSPDYKKLDIITVGGTKKSIDLLPIISHSKITELSDVDSTNQGNGKTLVYNSATGKHEYVDSSSTDELVKMDSTSTAKHLGDLIDKTTIVNDNGKLVAKTLDGLTASITELNYIKGLQMPVQDLVTAFANGGLKTIDTPFPTYADLQSYDVSTLLDDIRYLVRVLADETHDGKITAYLIKKGQTAPTFYGYLSDSRNFKTNPIDLVNEITGKLKAKNIDSDDLFALLTLSDVYKTATAKDEIFGTHGAKAMYDELNTIIGKKANNTDLTTHTGDTDIHASTTEKATWNTVTSKASKSDLTTHTSNTNIHVTTADKTKWNEVDNKVNKTDITTTIDSTSIDDTVPSAKAVYDTFNQKADKTNIYEIKEGEKSKHIVIDLPASHSISGKTTRLFASDNTLAIGLQIWNGNILEKDFRAPVINTNHIFIPTKALTPVSANINFTNEDSSCDYMVINGICYVNIWSMNITADLNIETLFDDLPTAKASAQFILSDSIGSKTVGMGWIDRGSRIIVCNAKLETESTKSQGYARFSYPVAEE